VSSTRGRGAHAKTPREGLEHGAESKRRKQRASNADETAGWRGVYSPTSSVRTPISRVVTTRRGTCRRRGHSTAHLPPIISSHACDRVHLHARGNAAASRLKFRAAARLRISVAHEASHPLLHPVARSFKRRVARTAESAPFVPLRHAATGIHPRGIPSSLDASLTGRARVASSAPNYADTPGVTQSPVIMVEGGGAGGDVTRAGIKLVFAVGLISRAAPLKVRTRYEYRDRSDGWTGASLRVNVGKIYLVSNATCKRVAADITFTISRLLIKLLIDIDVKTFGRLFFVLDCIKGI